MEINSIKFRIYFPNNIVIFAFLFTCLFLSTSIPQNKEPRFEHLSVKDGLPENSVKSILQDNLGFLWFGTQNGLASYDGYKLTVYQHDPAVSSSISGNSIMAIYEDSYKKLWIGTWNSGLNYFDRATESFQRYENNLLDRHSIDSDMIYSIYEDSQRRLWVATGKGLNLFNESYNGFNHYYFSDKTYSKEIHSYLKRNIKESAKIGSILKVGNNADIEKSMEIKKRTPVIIIMVGEAGNDYGWLEYKNGERIFTYNYDKSFHAGGGLNNRIQIKIDTLEAGAYELHYKSNHFYSYQDNYSQSGSLDYKVRVGDPPEFKEYWGIQVFSLTNDLREIVHYINKIVDVEVQSPIFAITELNNTRKILIGTNSPGLWELDEKSKTIKRSGLFILQNEPSWSIEAFHKLDTEVLYAATTKGLVEVDTRNLRYQMYMSDPNSQNSINNHLNSITEDRDGDIWVGTIFNGIQKFDNEKKLFSIYKNTPDNPYSITRNDVLTCYSDKSGIIWAGIWTGGICKWDKYKWKFQRFSSKIKKIAPLFQEHINSICEDSKQRFWIGNYNGIYRYNPQNEEVKHYKHNRNDSKSLSSDSVNYILADSKDPNVIWVGTMNGLNRFNSTNEEFIKYLSNPNDKSSIGNNYISFLMNDRTGNLWIGTRGGGLNRFDRQKNNFIRIRNDPSKNLNIAGDFILSIYEDHNGNILFGHNGRGIYQYNPKRNETSLIDSSLSFSGVLSLLDIGEGKLWVGTFMNGLYLFDRLNGKILRHYDIFSGLKDNIVLSINSDSSGNIWFGSYIGLTFLDLKNNLIRHYNEDDGIITPSNISPYILYKTFGGNFIYCGQNGFNVFNPDNIKPDPIAPNVVINKLTLFNRPDEKLDYEGFISEIDEVTLSYSQNDLHFEYVGLHYGEPTKNQYKYILEGFDKDWIDAGNLRTATYTNLDPGEYIFRVKASNRDGIWNENGASLKIIINPPLWATTWAYLFYLILFGSLLYFIWRMQLKRVRVKHEYEMSKFEAQKLHEVDEIKSRFFANISHEFRTPLTLILGPVKQIIERTKETKTKEDLNLVRRNANKLLGLVNQLLDISKIESGNMKLQTIPIKIIPYLKALVLSFTSYAERKRISLKFISDLDDLTVYIDKDKFEKIINNVLSNAFKFTPDGGTIEVIVNQDSQYLKVAICDTGVGIPKDKMQKIFDRFYQVDGSHTREQEGTGIGLSLTKELVELHKGNIEVESDEGKGSTFRISIPLGTDHLTPEEICELESDKLESYQFENTLIVSPENKINNVDTDAIMQADKPLLLIVEDNYDVRNYIKANLDNGYRIIEAVDGEDGWNKSTNNLPDLIISDVMMPKMDGFELCKKLKTDERTSHIPVILLTAKAAKQDKIDGYEIGADEYLMKPFEPDELSARIKNLILQREKLQDLFKKNGMLSLGQTQIKSVDKIFLQNVLSKIDQHISDSSFSVEFLSEDLGISRSVLHRKILSLTGETPGDLIRRIRLNKAAVLIKSKFGNLSEVALEVGFNNPAHFSENFKKQFGISPSHYQ